ncbi:flavin reductase family protein [Streptomyces capillispiralis]|uniref:Flavin reductase (DIM6/NTAB) family NADH-FMN oxidoreductase RutF n=2 Tax=Streptomyces capillispiralis TaxID=68182 RepID=A0A561TPA5_9ACTN|nr:flavin reductase family protein [Streptomyces capillispiralis]TWF88951.1 flavin reductase (DIM6/NTAB) family NADH-FMN oxidoreductase RutF [Streptomyces capillispiralis]GHH93220.1 oxidoreductase [Streptomyces capillispiralis]
MAIDDELFRAMFSAHPAAVCVVTAAGADGRPSGLTTSAVTSVSMEPPLLLVCVGTGSRTLAAIRHSGGFAVNFLAVHNERLSERFAGKSTEKFAGLDWRPSGRAAEAPLLPAYHLSAAAECLVHQEIPAGDHCVFLGRIEGAVVHGRAPMLYHERDYIHLPVPALSGTATAD